MSDIEVKSYRYLRTAMVALLLGLGAAVVYHTMQAGAVLASVSAYYYTPAQAIFVGALIALGACMIALKGTNGVEDLFLNLGGMFAVVVAIVPTSRGADYRTAVRACEQADSPVLEDLDCPTVRALAEATEANVENSTVALLIVGALALLTAVLFFALKDRRTPGAKFPWWAFVATLVVYGVGAAAFTMSKERFIDNAHYVAAIGLLVCIVVVAVANALRRDEGRQETLNAVPGALLRSRDAYAWIARIMLGGAVVGVVLWLVDWISLFLLEIVVAAFFAVFWMVQTIERWRDEPPPAAGEREPVRPGEPVPIG
jgi:FtsH-binding integral membrane protein